MKIKNNINKLKYFIICISLIPSLALAGTCSYDGDHISQALAWVITALTTTYIRVIGVVAIITVGYMTIALGKFAKSTFIMIIVGVGIVLGSAQIASNMGWC